MVFLRYFSRLSVVPAILAWRLPVLLEPDQLSTADVCQKVLPAIFRIISDDPYTGVIKGIGSGFFIKKDGTGLTAHHVLEKKGNYRAKLDSGEEFSMKIINYHPLSDIALVQVNVPHAVPFLTLGNSDSNRRGEQILHFGNTLYGTTTEIDVGYINKVKDDTPKWLEIQMSENLQSSKSGIQYILTTGYVRPGFSGGPLVNMKGEVIGLISRLYIRNNSNFIEHEGASVPINIVKDVVKQMELAGHVKKPYIGMSFTPNNTGLVVLKIQPESPAEKAGIQIGDVILTVNGKKIDSPEDFITEIGFHIGVILNCRVLRGNQEINVKVFT